MPRELVCKKRQIAMFLHSFKTCCFFLPFFSFFLLSQCAVISGEHRSFFCAESCSTLGRSYVVRIVSARRQICCSNPVRRSVCLSPVAVAAAAFACARVQGASAALRLATLSSAVILHISLSKVTGCIHGRHDGHTILQPDSAHGTK